MNSRLVEIEKLVGHQARGPDDQSWLVFDWESLEPKRREAFLGELFGDWSGDSSTLFASLVTRERQGRRVVVRWSNARLVPFALANVDSTTKRWVFKGGSSFPQFGELMLADIKATGTPVFALEVDGTAVDTGKLVRRGRLGTLKLRAEAAADDEFKAPEKAAKSSDSKASMRRDSDTAKSIEKAIEAFHSVSNAFRSGKPTAAVATVAMTKCLAKLKRIEALLASATRFADLGAVRIGADYRALLTHIDAVPFDDRWWNTSIISRMQHDAQYFRSLSADLYHFAAGTSWWPKRDLETYSPTAKKKKRK